MNSAAMEQIAKYWGMRGSVRRTTAAAYSSSEPSWEEQAFARDAAANLAWPPRSYSCTFCHREFRSAQALGGHMNVHRRDRARLRQGDYSPSPDPDDDVLQEAPLHQHGRQDHQPHQDSSFMYRAISNLSAATIIKESKNQVLTMSLAAARDRQEAIDVYHHDVDGEEELGRTKKRRRVDQPPAIFALVVAPPQGGFDADAKVHKTSASPSSSAPLVDQQEVDLELRLGTTPKVS